MFKILPLLPSIFLFIIFITSCGAELTANSNLIGGEPVHPYEYRETVRLFMDRGSCTGVVVGPRVLLTAAHCVETSDVKFQAYNRMIYYATCHLAPGYKRSVGDQDIAICILDKVHPPPYASIATSGPELEEDVILMGYGCTEPDTGRGGNDGILRKGVVKVVRLPQGNNHSFYTHGDVALCFGDSGGPSYLISKNGDHIVIGVNSRGDIRKLSLMTSVWHPETLEFLARFESATSYKICGLGAICEYREKKPHCG